MLASTTVTSASPAWQRRCPVQGRYSRRRPPPAFAARFCSDKRFRRGNDRARRRAANGSSTGSEPVAMTIVSARMTCAPVSVSTSTVLPSRNLPRPCTIFTRALRSRPSTPLFSRPTMPSFQRDGLGKIEFRRLDRDTERALGGRHMAAPSRIPPAAWISALEGCSRHSRQVPPACRPFRR